LSCFPGNFLLSSNHRLRSAPSIIAHTIIAIPANSNHHHEAPLIRATPVPQVAATRNAPLTISALVLGHNILGRCLPGGHIRIVPYRNHKATRRRIIPIANFILLLPPNQLAGTLIAFLFLSHNGENTGVRRIHHKLRPFCLITQPDTISRMTSPIISNSR
jgi:hypothetical protein